MDLTTKNGLNALSHDLFIGGSQSLLKKLAPDDSNLQYTVGNPYPISKPFPYERMVDTIHFSTDIPYFQGKIQKQQEAKVFQKAQIKKEFATFMNDVNVQDTEDRDFVVLPEFFINYVEEEAKAKFVDASIGHNSLYSQGILEQLQMNGRKYLIRPSIYNKLVLTNVAKPKRERQLEYLLTEPTFNLQGMRFSDSQYLIARHLKSIDVLKFTEELEVVLETKLSSKIPYANSKVNPFSVGQIGILDSKNKLSLFDLTFKKIISNFNRKVTQFSDDIVSINFLSSNRLLLASRKEVKFFDTRQKDSATSVRVSLKDCDIIMNTVVEADNIHMLSKHCYFAFDQRNLQVDDYLSHNLKSSPCYLNVFDNFVTIASSNCEDKIIFCKDSLPYLPNSIMDTMDSCRRHKPVPVVPYLEERLRCPVAGTQLIPDANGFSIYTANILGEIFRQEVSLGNPSNAETPLEKLHKWIETLNEPNITPLSLSHFVNASAPFFYKSDNKDDIELSAKSGIVDGVRDYLLKIQPQFEKYDIKDFADVWEDDSFIDGELSTSLRPESPQSKVEKWMERTDFMSGTEDI